VKFPGRDTPIHFDEMPEMSTFSSESINYLILLHKKEKRVLGMAITLSYYTENWQ